MISHYICIDSHFFNYLHCMHAHIHTYKYTHTNINTPSHTTLYYLSVFYIKRIFFHIFSVPYIAIDDDRGVSTPEKFYRIGSTIELKCIIDKIPHRANYVMWKHGMRMLNYDTSRGGIR